MGVGIRFGLTSQQGGFNPLTDFFAPTDGGVFLRMSQTNTLFQDVGGTTPVTASGQYLGAVRDLFKGALVATPSGATTCLPSYIIRADGKPQAQFSSDDYWQISLDLSAYDNVVIAAVLEKSSDAATGVLVEYTANSTTTNGGFAMFAPIGAAQSIRSQSRGATNATAATYTNAAVAAGQKFVAIAAMDTNTRNVLYINGVERASATTSQGGGNYANSILYIARRGGSTSPFNGGLLALAICASTEPKTTAQLTALNSWMQQEGGV